MIGQENNIAKDKLAWKQIDIQPRDERLFNLLLHQKFLTLDQIHRWFFPDSSLQMPRMRMRKLMHFGLVRTQKVYTEPRQVYLLGKAGYRYLENKGQSQKLGLLSEIDLRVFEHDKAVTDLRLALESAGADSEKSERELRHERPASRVPDALFSLNGRTIAL